MIVFKLVHCENGSPLISVTLLGIAICAKAMQLSKAANSIVIRPSGSVTLVRLLQVQKCLRSNVGEFRGDDDTSRGAQQECFMPNCWDR